MSRLTACTAALVILIGSVWTQEQLSEIEIEESLPRFGFGLLEPLRKSFCQNYCSSSDMTPYLTNLICAIKCPELYLPHPTTTTSTAPSSSTESTKTTDQSSQTTAKPSAPTTETSSSATTKPSGTTNSAETTPSTLKM